MKFLNFIKKRKKRETLAIVTVEKPQKVDDYTNLIEIAKIISNNDVQVIEDMELLAENFEGFLSKYNKWCTDMFFDLNCREATVLNIFAYWLCGYDTDFVYGVYIDWKEETEDIIFFLKKVVEELKYPIIFDNYFIDYELDTHKSLQQINQFLKKQKFTLLFLDTGGDCYHLFIVNSDDVDNIDKMSVDIGFKFHNL